MKKVSFISTAVFLFFVIMGCEKDRIEPVVTNDVNIELRANNCFNFKSSFEGCINLVGFEIEGVTYQGLGALPASGSVGDYEGQWASIIIEERESGNGASHFKLIHKFLDNEGDYFYTEDKAVCAPAKGSSATCLINDQMTIVGGTGKFASISGKVKTHGPLTFGDPACPYDYGSLSLELHGRICLD